METDRKFVLKWNGRQFESNTKGDYLHVYNKETIHLQQRGAGHPWNAVFSRTL